MGFLRAALKAVFQIIVAFWKKAIHIQNLKTQRDQTAPPQDQSCYQFLVRPSKGTLCEPGSVGNVGTPSVSYYFPIVYFPGLNNQEVLPPPLLFSGRGSVKTGHYSLKCVVEFTMEAI